MANTISRYELDEMVREWISDMQYGFDSVDEYVEYEFAHMNLSEEQKLMAVVYISERVF